MKMKNNKNSWIILKVLFKSNLMNKMKLIKNTLKYKNKIRILKHSWKDI